MMRDGRRWMGVLLLLLLLNHSELKCQQQTEAFVDFKVVGKVKPPDGQLRGVANMCLNFDPCRVAERSQGDYRYDQSEGRWLL